MNCSNGSFRILRWCLTILVCQTISAENDFHSFQSLYIQATAASHYDYLSNSSFDPRIGALWTFPVFYNFLHIDLSAEISPRPFLAPDYGMTIDNDHFTNSQSVSYLGKELVWDQKGVEAVISFAPTVYLRHLYFGICGAFDIEYLVDNYRHIMLDKMTQDTVYDHTTLGRGAFYFDEYLPGIKLGWRFTEFSIFAVLLPGHCGLSYSQKIWGRPIKKMKIRKSVFDD